MSFGGQTPTIIVLKEGSRPHHHLAELPLTPAIRNGHLPGERPDYFEYKRMQRAVQATIKSTLGPYGGDLLIVDANGKQTITNDGATVMKVGNSRSSSMADAY